MTDPFSDDASELIKRGWLSKEDLASERAPIPPQIGPYTIVRLLGQGGLGDVYLAEDKSLGRPVALKILRELAPMQLERFVRECKVASLLSHPNIAQVYDAGQVEGWHFISMQYVDGGPIGQEPRPIAQSVETMRQIALAVHYAHSQGVIHRDIKPGNILVDRTGRTFLVDFGLAKQTDARGASLTGMILGTPAYMSPEQAHGDVHRVDARTDVYGLGATLYTLVSGRPPFPDDSLYATVRRVIEEDPPNPSRIAADVPRELELIILKAMAKEPERRYRSAEEFAADLKRYQDSLPITAHPPSLVYQVRKRIVRHKGATAGLALAVLIAILLIPKWMAAEREVESLQELSGLWNDVVLARQGWYQAQKDPDQTRRQVQQSVDRVREFVHRNPKQPNGHYVLARGLLYLDELDAAMASLDESVRLDPDFAAAHSLKGRVLLEKYRMALVVRESRKAERVQESEPLLAQAVEEIRRGVGGTSGVRPTDEDRVAEALTKAMWAYYGSNDRKRAREILEEAGRAAASEEYCNLLGLWSDDSKDNVRWQTEAIRIMPHNPRAYQDRGYAKRKLGDWAGAKEDYTKVLALGFRPANALLNRSYVRGKLGDFQGTIEDARAALAINPALAEAYLNLSTAHSALEKYKEAEAFATEALKIDPTYVDAITGRAACRINQEDYDRALEDCEAALKIDARSYSAYLNRGACYARMGKHREAFDDAAKAIEIDPTRVNGFLNRALAGERLALRKEGDVVALLRGVLRDYEKVLELADPQWPSRSSVVHSVNRLRATLKDLDREH
jgi:tetratricopeptide (TPR) repeat protein